MKLLRRCFFNVPGRPTAAVLAQRARSTNCASKASKQTSRRSVRSLAFRHHLVDAWIGPFVFKMPRAVDCCPIGCPCPHCCWRLELQGQRPVGAAPPVDHHPHHSWAPFARSLGNFRSDGGCIAVLMDLLVVKAEEGTACLSDEGNVVPKLASALVDDDRVQIERVHA